MFEDHTIRRMFKKLLRAYTKQNVDMLLDTEDLFAYDTHEHKWHPNRFHPLFQSTRFKILVSLLVNEFLCMPQCQDIGPDKEPLVDKHEGPELSSIDIMEIITRVDYELDREMEKYFPDLTYATISAVAGDKYESDDADGLCAVFASQPLNYEAFLPGFYRVNTGDKKDLSFNSIHAHRKFLNLSSQGKKRKPDLDTDMEPPAHQQCLVYERKKENGQVRYEIVGFAERQSALALLPGVLFFAGSRWGYSLPFMKWGQDGEPLPEAEPQCIAVVRDGHFCLPDYPPKSFQQLEERWLQKYWPKGSTTAYTVLQAAKRQKKGALVILSEASIMQKVANNVAQNQMEIQMNPREPLNLAEQKEYLYSFCSIDGAVLLDYDGQCYAIGAIISGDPATRADGDIGRGSRYNSAISFLAWAEKEYPGELFLVIIVSEDGDVEVLPKKG